MELSLVQSVHACLHMQHFTSSMVLSMMFVVSLPDQYGVNDVPRRCIDLRIQLCVPSDSKFKPTRTRCPCTFHSRPLLPGVHCLCHQRVWKWNPLDTNGPEHYMVPDVQQRHSEWLDVCTCCAGDHRLLRWVFNAELVDLAQGMAWINTRDTAPSLAESQLLYLLLHSVSG